MSAGVSGFSLTTAQRAGGVLGDFLITHEEINHVDDRRRQILTTLAQMDKQLGKGSVLMLGSRAAIPVEVITT